MKRSPLKKVSAKRAKDLVIYNALRRLYLQDRPLCECRARTNSCYGTSQHVHHIKGRGKMLNEVKFWLPVCIKCHDWIHSHAKQARALGLLLSLILFAGCAYQGTPPGAMPPCETMHCVYVANGWLPQ